MSNIVLIDTSIYLNILDIPEHNQDRKNIFNQFQDRINNHDYFLLPMAAIWETGDHIAHLVSGELRYRLGKRLLADVTNALEGNTPYRPTFFPTREEFFDWLKDFPDYVKRSKSEKKQREGISLSDLSIIKEWEITKARHNMTRVLIWSLDSDLYNYDSGMR